MKTTYNNYSNFNSYSNRTSSLKVYEPKAKSKQPERWDHGGFEQLQTETINKPIIQANIHKQQEQKTTANRTKRPDKVLYNARQKHGSRTETIYKPKESSIQCTERLTLVENERKDASSPYLQPAKDILAGNDDKEAYMLEDDRMSVSNVSTAMSDHGKAWDEERTNMNDVTQSLKEGEMENYEALFDMVLETHSGTVHIRIFKGEEDYEAVLNQICQEQGFEAKFGLYFKINMLQLISQTVPDDERVNCMLDNLLDINYKLVMYEDGSGEADESIVPYIESQGEESCGTH